MSEKIQSLPDEHREAAAALARNWLEHPTLRVYVRDGYVVGLKIKDEYYVALPDDEIQKIPADKAVLYFDDAQAFAAGR